MSLNPSLSSELFGSMPTIFGESDTPYAMPGTPPETTEPDRYWDRFTTTVKALKLSPEIEVVLPPLPRQPELGE
ncbi:MAG: hypothetical protein JWN82_434 [Candidatus Saccharibacteria bacterium]|nr:hypothetical protein [Candidatus Saccharibacteria bacterium]